LEYDWENSVGCWISSTSHALRKSLGASLSREGITLRQFEVLSWLSTGGGCGSQSELAESMGIEPHTLAGVLSRMERDGLLQRRSCEQDRRKNKIQPTEKAELIWEKVSNICHEVRGRAVRDFTQEELTQLRLLCDRIRANLGEGHGEAPNQVPVPHHKTAIAAPIT
jgi:MarR family transcriptional regulator for hemolysin